MKPRTITPKDPEWPERLSELGPLDPPSALHARGQRLDPHLTAVAVVGTRRPSAAGTAAAYRIARSLAEAGFVVVSGLAVGIDATAHRAALDAGGTTVAVLGCGLDVDYPRRNSSLRDDIARRGTILTEHEAGTPPHKANFPRRNRIIAGLAQGVVVIEGAITSGALVTARLALEANRAVYAVPGSVRNPMAEGPNELIRCAQAQLVTCAQHVFEDLAPQLAFDLPVDPAKRLRDSLTDEERAVHDALDDAPVPPDALGLPIEMSAGRLGMVLARLEVKGLAVHTPGGYARA